MWSRGHHQPSAARMTRPPARLRNSLADVLHELGGVAPTRVRAWPLPGMATERDLIGIQRREKRYFELVDGTLVEKVMGAPEACLTVELNFALKLHLQQHDAGFTMGPD